MAVAVVGALSIAVALLIVVVVVVSEGTAVDLKVVGCMMAAAATVVDAA